MSVKEFPNKNKRRKVIRCPAGLSDRAKRHWKLVTSRAEGFESLDIDILTLYCEAWARWEQAQENIEKIGVIVKGNNNTPVQSPYLPVANKAFDQLKALLPELQLTPRSRGASVQSRNSDDEEWWDKI